MLFNASVPLNTYNMSPAGLWGKSARGSHVALCPGHMADCRVDSLHQTSLVTQSTSNGKWSTPVRLSMASPDRQYQHHWETGIHSRPTESQTLGLSLQAILLCAEVWEALI